MDLGDTIQPITGCPCAQWQLALVFPSFPPQLPPAGHGAAERLEVPGQGQVSRAQRRDRGLHLLDQFPGWPQLQDAGASGSPGGS